MQPTPVNPGQKVTAPGELGVVVSVVWTGQSLRAFNLAALTALRKNFTTVPLVHLVSPAYFIKPPHRMDRPLAKIRPHLQPRDLVGLYLSGWKSIASSANVTFRKGPTFWGNNLTKNCETDCGHEVPVTAYPEKDLLQLIKTSQQILQNNRIPVAPAIAAGGWLASPAFLRAAEKNNFRYDFSAVPAKILEKRLAYYPLHAWIKGLWPAIMPTTQPFVIKTGQHSMTSYVNNLGAVDYASVAQIQSLVNSHIDLVVSGQRKKSIIHIRMFQETAHRYLSRLEAFLTYVYQACQPHNIRVKPFVPGKQEQGRRSPVAKKRHADRFPAKDLTL